MFPFMVASATAASRLASTCRHSLACLRVVTKHACSWVGPGRCSGGGWGPGSQSFLSQVLLGHHTVLRSQAVGTVSSPAFSSHASFPLPFCWSLRVSASALATAFEGLFFGKVEMGSAGCPSGACSGQLHSDGEGGVLVKVSGRDSAHLHPVVSQGAGGGAAAVCLHLCEREV